MKLQQLKEDSYNKFMFFEIIKTVESWEKIPPQNKKTKVNFFAVISTKPVEIVFKKTIYNIKEVNRKYVTTQ